MCVLSGRNREATRPGVRAGGGEDEVGLSPVAPRVAAPPWTGKLSGSQVPGAKPPPPLASRAAVRAGEAGETAARALGARGSALVPFAPPF